MKQLTKYPNKYLDSVKYLIITVMGSCSPNILNSFISKHGEGKVLDFIKSAVAEKFLTEKFAGIKDGIESKFNANGELNEQKFKIFD